MSGHFGARAAPDSQAEMANVSDAKAITTNCSAISHFRSLPDHPHSHARARPGRIESPHAVAAADSCGDGEWAPQLRRAPEGWEKQPAKNAQKDKDARWTKKNDESFYGYKNHLGVDTS